MKKSTVTTKTRRPPLSREPFALTVTVDESQAPTPEALFRLGYNLGRQLMAQRLDGRTTTQKETAK